MLGEYDAGYENYIDSLIREMEKLQDENDKLREQVSSLVGRSFRTADKMSCIEAENAKLRNDAELLRAMLSQVQTEKRCYMAENAKLRELVRDMYRDFVNCDCELRLHGRTFMAETRYAHRMRELGVEVE